MKKKTLGRIALCAFALCLVSTSVASKTLARFISHVEAKGVITVANFTDFSFKKGDNSVLTLSDTKEFNLADTKNENLLVKEGTIAPGDQGSFKIVLGASDVPYTYTLALSAVGGGEDAFVPVTFYSDSEMTNIFEQPAADTSVGFGVGGNADATEEVVHNVYWRWNTEDLDPETDRDITYENVSTSFTIDLEATQTMPTP